MNSLLDLIGSYIIGGLLVLGIMTLVFKANSQSQQSKINEIAHRNSVTTGKMIEYDFEKIGYRVETGSKIQTIASNSIKFLSDIDNNQVIDTITYSTYSVNSQLFLKRRVANASAKEFSMAVNSFSVQGKDSAGNNTANVSLIKSIVLNLTLPESNMTDSYFDAGGFWRRQFFPKNL